MGEELYYSIRMRAFQDGRHIGGAERLVPERDWTDAMGAMTERARDYAAVGTIQWTSEPVRASEITCIRPLPVRPLSASSSDEAREAAITLLIGAGISRSAAKVALKWLDTGAAPGNSIMRGAMILNGRTGERLERDPARGVRVSRVDFAPRVREQAAAALQNAGLPHHRALEALVIASKVAWAGVRAELCWSDDPCYLAGYVASAEAGYCRFEQMKRPGSPFGGRAFFVDPDRLPDREVRELILRLERAPVLLNAAPRVCAELSPGFAGAFLNEGSGEMGR